MPDISVEITGGWELTELSPGSYRLSVTPVVITLRAPAPVPAYTPSLDFSDERNSQYALFPLFVW